MVALPQSAAADSLVTACHAYPQNGESYADIAARPAAWTCGDANWLPARERALLRFDLGPRGVVPDQVATRLARFDALRVGIEHGDGAIAWTPLGAEEFKPHGHMQIVAGLPQRGRPARAVILEFVGSTATGQLEMTVLQSDSASGFGVDELYLAGLCGLLLAPLLLNLGFYRVLRERFLLWHALVVASLTAHIVVTSGLVRVIGEVPVGLLSYLVTTTYCLAVAAAAMLAVHFVEDDKFEPRHRNALRCAAAWALVNGAVFVALADSQRHIAGRLYLAGWLPVIAVVVWAMHAAVQRNSRAIWFQIAAWAPMIAVGIARMIYNAAGRGEALLIYRAQDLAVTIEVVVISIGIIDRFVGLRRDLERQLRKVDHLEALAERDPLTGMFNRRAIERRFADLRREGFSTLAVVDLDRFKDINDRFGHDMGDRVLQSVSRTLAPSDDLISMRLGGEEFVLLLRGRNAFQHAEWCRKAIPVRAANEVHGLDRLVTASMGLVEIPGDVMPDATFAAIFARADRLLYQAKRGGRNRVVSERMTSFTGHRQPRPKARRA